MSSQILIANKMFAANKVFVINEFYDDKAGDKLIEKFIKPKTKIFLKS